MITIKEINGRANLSNVEKPQVYFQYDILSFMMCVTVGSI